MTTTTVDLGPLVQIAAAFLAVVLPAIATYIAWVLKQKMNIQQNSADAQVIDVAAQRAGGLAQAFVKQIMPVNPTVDVRNAAIAQGLNHIIASVPDAVGRLGITTDTLTRMVNSELSQLEHLTPIPVHVTTVVAPTPEPVAANPPATPPVADPAATVTRTTSTSQTVGAVSNTGTGAV